MKQKTAAPPEHFPDPYHDAYSRTTFGFWIYLLSDFMLFATLFAAYAVLRAGTAYGPEAKDLTFLNERMLQTLLLLFSSFTIGMGGAAAHRRNKRATIGFFVATFLLGLGFLIMQSMEFTEFFRRGWTWEKSAFLSAYYTLIGTHTIHVILGVLWIIVFLIPVFFEGVSPVSLRRLTCLRLFWQFVNIIWVFIFTIVYLLGAVL